MASLDGRRSSDFSEKTQNYSFHIPYEANIRECGCMSLRPRNIRTSSCRFTQETKVLARLHSGVEAGKGDN